MEANGQDESYKKHCPDQGAFSNLRILQTTRNTIIHLAIDADITCFSTLISTNKMASMKRSPNTAASTQDLSDESSQPRIASGTLPPQAAHAPEFVPGDLKAADASSGKEETGKKNKKNKDHTKAEKEAEEKAQKQQALDEEWWSDDDIFCA